MHKLKKSKFLIIVPAFNELKSLKKFIKKLNNLVPVFVLDDYSNDGTSNWLKKNRIKFIRNNKNLGYEKNLINGIKKLKNNCEFIITFDGDNQHKISDLKKIIKITKIYDVLICNRKNKNRIMEECISILTFYLFGFKDPLSGLKVYKTKIIKQEHLKENYKLFMVDFLLSFKEKAKILNLEIDTRNRKDKPRVGNFIKVFFKEVLIFFYIFYKWLKI
jgi:hypothetical protein